MEGLLQPPHLILIMAMVLTLVHAGRKNLTGLLRRFDRDFRLRRLIPDQSIPGLRVYSPEQTQGTAMERKTFDFKRWLKYLTIILVGNLIYFKLLPYLPPGARHRSFHVDAGTLVDLWFCLIVFGVVELAEFLWKRHKAL